MPFRYTGLPVEPFLPLFALGDEVLARRGIRRMIADARPGFPCRVSLEDAQVGERVLLLAFEHQPAPTPYRASGPIFVRERARETYRGSEVPPVLRTRLLSLRAYDKAGMMVGADVVPGDIVESALERLFDGPGCATVHVHNARPGCFACRVERG